MKLTLSRFAAAALLVCLAISASVSHAEELVKLELQLPKPLFAGTPKTLKTPNLEEPRKGPRPDLMVPPGTTNVAAGRPVTSSDQDPNLGKLAQVTDGDKAGADGSYVELSSGLQWVQIDLGAKHNLSAILVWHFHGEPRVYRDVVVQVADDADFITGVKTLFNNDHDNSSGLGIGTDKEYVETNEGKLIEAKGVTARYVRLYSNGNTSSDQNHYVEVEVYGTKAK